MSQNKPYPVVIFTTAYFPMVGGAEVAIKEITDRLPDTRFDLFCAKLRRDTLHKEHVGNVLVHRIGFGIPLDKYLFPLFAPMATLFVAKGKRGVIWSVMASYGGFAGLFFSWMKPRWKFLLTLQEGDPLERYQQHAGMFDGLRRKIFTRAHTVHAISKFLATWAKEMGVRVEPSIIPNGVDIELFSIACDEDTRISMRRAFGFDSQHIVLVTASRLSHKNAVDDVVRALALLPERYTLLILGSGEDEDTLKSLVETLGLQTRVVFKGTVSHAELPALLQSADVFIRPSRSEGLGNAFLEAMAAGLPVIGTPVGGIPDFLLDGETGIFCQPNDPRSIMEAVKRLENPQLRERLIEQGRNLVIQKYDWDEITIRMKEILHI